MDLDTHDKAPYSNQRPASTTHNDFPSGRSTAPDLTLASAAPQTTKRNTIITDINTLSPSTAFACSSQEETQDDQQCRTPSLYTRLKSLFQHKDRSADFPTPPPSPQNQKLCKLDTSPYSSESLSLHQLPTKCEGLFPDNSENLTSMLYLEWTPLTPDSIDRRHGHGLDSWPGLVHLSKEFTLGNEGRETEGGLGLENDLLKDIEAPLDVSNMQMGVQLAEDVNNQGLETNLYLELSSRVVSAQGGANQGNPNDDGYLYHNEGVHLVEDKNWHATSRLGDVHWGKSRAPPIPWDILIDDLSSPASLAWNGDSESQYRGYGSVDAAHSACNNEYEDDFYDLQYALELSRRDRRRFIDSDPNSAGEYSKSRESWAILHLNRVMPADQEYWFKYWLQWHSHLEAKLAFRLHKAQRKEEFVRHQSIDPWPVTDRRTARHPRHADEELHPNLRLMRHRTRSAPGRIRT